MIFSYNWLQSFFEKKFPKPEKIAGLLTSHFAEVEEIKKRGKDFTLDIDVRPNRAHDCLCHLGIAREISAILGGKLILLERKKIKLEKKKNILPIDLKIKCPLLILRYSAIIIEGVKIGPSPAWIRKKLEAVGIRSINNIVDLTNFLMLETGQPFHAFDYDKILGQKMILRQSKKGEKIITLDDTERILDNGTLVIEDEKRLIDLVGIMGGKLSEIDSGTKNIIVQAGNFDRKTIYQTAKNLKHSTPASNIYSQGIDLNLTIPSLERFNFLLQKSGGGKIVQIIDICPQKACPLGSRKLSLGVLPKKIKLDLNYIERLLGIKIPEKDIKTILEKLNFKVKPQQYHRLVRGTVEKKQKFLEVEVPTFRLDISCQEDLIEEVGRIYGYEKIPAIFPVSALIPSKKNYEIFWEDMIKDILKEAGFTEVYNYSFISEKEAIIFSLAGPGLVEVDNPISAEQRYLRPSLIPNLLKNVQKNHPCARLGAEAEIKIFELGKIFRIENCKLKIVNCKEKRMLAGIITGDAFFEAKGVIDLLLNKLGISNIWYAEPRSELCSTTGDEYQATSEGSKLEIWQPKKCAEIKIGQEEIGFLGEISPKILADLKIEGRVCVFDLDFEKLSRLASEETIYQPISRFPAAIRDIAILTPKQVKVEEILNEIETAGGEILRDVDLFDIYEGEEIPGNKKNLAFHLIYQAKDRTLSSKEIDEIHNKIIKTLESEPERQVRK